MCCPARAQIQTGQLSHNNRVVSQTAAKNLDPRDTIQHDLGAARRRHLRHRQEPQRHRRQRVLRRRRGATAASTHFNFWNSYRGAPGAFKLYDETGRRYTPTDGLDTTETNGAYLDALPRRPARSDEPFFVYDAFFAPHKQGVGGSVADLPAGSGRHADDPVPPFRFAPEGFDDDKLPIFQGARFYARLLRRLFTARVRALCDVDDQMADVFERLEATGTLDETAVIFVSDNGYTDRGQDNWEGKSIPYPAATNIPMLARFPGRPPAVEKKPVALIDIAPTLYDVFGVVPGHVVDGHSLLSDHRRELVYAEFYNENSGLSRRESGPLASNLRSWRVIKKGRQAYVEWYGNGGDTVFTEFYEDPGMTKNLLAPRAPRGPAVGRDRARRSGSCSSASAPARAPRPRAARPPAPDSVACGPDRGVRTGPRGCVTARATTLSPCRISASAEAIRRPALMQRAVQTRVVPGTGGTDVLHRELHVRRRYVVGHLGVHGPAGRAVEQRAEVAAVQDAAAVAVLGAGSASMTAPSSVGADQAEAEQGGEGAGSGAHRVTVAGRRTRLPGGRVAQRAVGGVVGREPGLDHQVLDRGVLRGLERHHHRDEPEVDVAEAQVHHDGGFGRDRQVDVAPVAVDRRHGQDVVEDTAQRTVVGFGQHLALDPPQQLTSHLGDVDEVGVGAGRVEGEPRQVEP